MKKALLAFTFVAALAADAGAAIVLNEPFTYADGSLITRPGSPWTTTSGTAGQVDVTSGKVNIDASETEDVGATFAPAGSFYNNGTLTATFDIFFTTLPTSAGTYFAHFKEAGSSNFRSRLFAMTTGAAGGSFRLGIADTTATVVALAADLSLNTTYSVTLSLDASTGRSKFAVTGILGGAFVTATDTTSQNQVAGFGLRQNTGEGVLNLDNLIVDAGGVLVPEPSTALTLLGGTGVLVAFRRMRRSARPSVAL